MTECGHNNRETWTGRNCQTCLARERDIQDPMRITHKLQQNRNYRNANLDFYHIRERGYKLRRKYGVSPDDYDRMLLEQNGLCAICSAPITESRRRFDVDHNHETMAVRGLLCSSCNVGLGAFRDSATLLLMAASYLGSHEKLNAH